jgi:hypothetical protein
LAERIRTTPHRRYPREGVSSTIDTMNRFTMFPPKDIEHVGYIWRYPQNPSFQVANR